MLKTDDSNVRDEDERLEEAEGERLLEVGCELEPAGTPDALEDKSPPEVETEAEAPEETVEA